MKTKELILSEALKLFAKSGYEAVSVAEIAESVGIKAPSLYKHYKSKRDIFDSIIERVNKDDSDSTEEYSMPGDAPTDAEMPSAEQIIDFTKAMFRYWTGEEFSCNFRRMLTIEQYNSDEMKRLYSNYFSEGPTAYMKDIFAKKTASESCAYLAAVEYFSPIHLMYSLYDNGESEERLLSVLEKHSENVLSRYGFLRSKK